MNLLLAGNNFLLKVLVCQFNLPSFSLRSLNHSLFLFLFCFQLTNKVFQLLLLFVSFAVQYFMLLFNLLLSSLFLIQNFFILWIFFPCIFLHSHAFSFLFLKLLSDRLNCWFIRSGVFKLSDSPNEILALSFHGF